MVEDSGPPSIGKPHVQRSDERAASVKMGDISINVRHMSVLVAQLSYSVKFGKNEKVILQNINMLLKSGDMCALMGASGAGKSTLLDLMADRKLDGTWSGELYVNDRPRSKSFNKNIAYVLQDDVHIPTLTVEEALTFAASTRLPDGTTQAAIKERVHLILNMLSLNDVKGSRVGSALKRGISGGQLKRLSIGVEIIALPKLIFLDEPTSGLDSALAFEVADAIKKFADLNHLCVSTIHQPSAAVFKLFNKTALLAEGRLIYFGPTTDIVRYFSSPELGFSFPARKNPAEFIIGISSGQIRPECKETPIEIKEMERLFLLNSLCEEISTAINMLRDESTPPSVDFDDEDGARMDTAPYKTTVKLQGSRPVSTFTAFRVLLHRTWIASTRDFEDLAALFGKFVVVGLLVGVVFYGQARVRPPFFTPDGVPKAEVTNVGSLLFFGVVDCMFGNTQAIPNLIMKYRVYRRELAANAYATFPYWLSNILVPIPILLSAFLLGILILYFMCGFPATFDYFLYFFIICFMCNLVTYYYAMFLAGVTQDCDLAFLIFPLSIVVLASFAGYAVTINTVPTYWSWLPWINHARWTFEGLIVHQWTECSGESYPGGNEGNSVLAIYGFQNFNKNNSYWIMGLFLVALTALVYWSLLAPSNYLKKVNNVSEYAQDVNSSSQKVDPLFTKELDFDQEKQELFGDWDSPSSNGCNVSIKSLSYTVVVKGSTSKEKKKILDNISCRFVSGECCALMGSSGAGKTSLMDVIANRKTMGELTGDLLFNGQPRSSMFFRTSAYVMQDDVHIGELTVRETLFFASQLRLPQGTNAVDRQQRIDFIVGVLGLGAVLDTKVGTDFKRGISGGQLKRLSIGVEIINLPDLIFLDEPTTGLDSTLAHEVMSAVRNLANLNRTIISTIHQPSEEVFALFDKLMVLSSGKMIYFGPAATATEYFKSSPMKYVQDEDSNPADFIIAVSGGFLEAFDGHIASSGELSSVFAESDFYKHLEADLDVATSAVSPAPAVSRDGHPSVLSPRAVTAPLCVAICWYHQSQGPPPVHSTSLSFQVFTLTRRVVLRYQYNKHIVISGILRNVFVGVFFGTIYYKMPGGTEATSYINRLSLLFFSILANVFTHQHAIPEVINSRLLFYRERGAGVYGTVPYWISAWLVEIPLALVYTMAYACVVYYTSELNSAPGAFWYFYLVLCLASLVGLFVSQFVAFVAPSTQVAVGLFPVVLMFSILFGGYIVYLPRFPHWLAWGPSISFLRFAFQPIVLNEFQGNDKLPLADAYIDQLGFNHLSKHYCLLVMLCFIGCSSLLQLAALKLINFEER